MSTYDDEDFEKLFNLTKENNKILKGLKRRAEINNIVLVLKWLIIISLGFGIYSFFQPYVTQVKNVYQSFSESTKVFSETADKVNKVELDVNNFFDNLKKD